MLLLVAVFTLLLPIYQPSKLTVRDGVVVVVGGAVTVTGGGITVVVGGNVTITGGGTTVVAGGKVTVTGGGITVVTGGRVTVAGGGTAEDVGAGFTTVGGVVVSTGVVPSVAGTGFIVGKDIGGAGISHFWNSAKTFLSLSMVTTVGFMVPWASPDHRTKQNMVLALASRVTLVPCWYLPSDSGIGLEITEPQSPGTG